MLRIAGSFLCRRKKPHSVYFGKKAVPQAENSKCKSRQKAAQFTSGRKLKPVFSVYVKSRQMCLKAFLFISSSIGGVISETITKTTKDTGRAIICGSIIFHGWPSRESLPERSLHSPIAFDSFSWINNIHKSEIKKPHRMLAFAPVFVPPLQ